jgi:hypothetical protein
MVRAIFNTIAVVAAIAAVALVANVAFEGGPRGAARRAAAKSQIGAAWDRAVGEVSGGADSLLGVTPPAKGD